MLASKPKTLGRGTFGTVHVDPTDRTRVIKKVKFTPDSLLRPRNFRELYALSLAPHPDLVRMTDLPSFTHNELQIQMPRALADLRTILPNVSAFSLSQLASIFYQVFCGLAALHSRGLIHYDLKPENILIYTIPISETEAPEVKLADFGLIQYEDTPFHSKPNYLTTSLYRAPEQLCLTDKALKRGLHYTLSPAADIFSAGRIMIEMLEAWANKGKPYMKQLACPNPDACPRETAEELARIFQAPEQTWIRDCGYPTYSVQARSGRESKSASSVSNSSSSSSNSSNSSKPGKLTWKEINTRRRKIPLWEMLYQLGWDCMAFDKTKRPTALEAASVIEKLLAETKSPVELPPCPKAEPLPEFEPWHHLEQLKELKELKKQVDPRLEPFIHLWSLDLSPVDSDSQFDFHRDIFELSEPTPKQSKSFKEMVLKIPAMISALEVPPDLVPAAFFVLASWIPRDESIDWISLKVLASMSIPSAIPSSSQRGAERVAEAEFPFPRYEDFRLFYKWLLNKLNQQQQQQQQQQQPAISRKRKVP